MESKVYIIYAMIAVLFFGGLGYFIVKNKPAKFDKVLLDSQVTDQVKNLEASPQKESEPTMEEQMTDSKQYNAAPEMQLKEGTDYKAVLKTNKGDITVDLFESKTPVTVNNFVFLAKEGFYSEVPFHRVIKGFMLQSGDPEGTGRGGPGYKFDDEAFEGEYTKGTLAMANAGPNTNGSQFFIMHADYPLPANYVIFGKADEAGFGVIDAIGDTPVEMSPMGENSVPTEPLFIESVEILEN